MRRSTKAVFVVVFAGCSAFYSGAAFAYTPQWLECSGDVTVTPADGPATKEAVKDVYVFDPDAKSLFKYSDARKSLSSVGAKPGKTEMELTWYSSGAGIGGISWGGEFDRTNLTVRVTYKGDRETRSWAEKCAPTAARPES